MSDLLAELLAAKTAVWTALAKSDRSAEAALLARDFLGVYPTGIEDRAAHLAPRDGKPALSDWRLSEARARPLGPDIALLVYRADYRQGTSEGAMYVSSIWRRRGAGWDAGWENVFSQDTAIDGSTILP